MIKLIFCCLIFISSTDFYSLVLPKPMEQNSQIKLSSYQGRKILIVNTAGGSEYASQYNSLEQLHRLYPDSLVIIAIPSNSFGNEPGTDSTITNYLIDTYDATFIVSGKVEVIGENQHPLYQWLTDQNKNGIVSNEVKSDFQKFLINEQGKLIGVFAPSVDPLSDELQSVIKGFE